MREYTRLQTLVANLPYLGMTFLGAAIFVAGFGPARWALLAGAAYVLYAFAGAFWIMLFVCPSCGFHGTRGCPCGYGWFSAKLRPRNLSGCFTDKFKKHIPVIVPLWFIPLIPAGISLYYGFTWKMVILLGLFVVVSFVILPLVSRWHGCAECPQREECPWMKRKTQKKDETTDKIGNI